MVINTLWFSFLGLLTFGLLKILQRLWWELIRIQKMMEAQGIRGPPYKFLHGNAKEAAVMVRESMSRPMDEISHDIAPRVQPHLHAWIKSYGRNILKWHGLRPQLLVTEPELIKEILNNREGAYVKIPTTGYVQKLLGDGLVAAEGKKWVRQRKLANNAFHAESIKGMIPAVVTSVENMLMKWAEYDSKEIDLYQEFKVMACDIISRTAFGSSYVEGKDIFRKLEKLTAILVKNSEVVQFPLIRKLSQDNKEACTLDHEIQNIIIKLIKNREESYHKGHPDGYGNDLLGLLVEANHERDQDARVSLEDIIDECKTFYFAGQETTVNLMSWTTLLLALHEDWQVKAREEAIMLFRHKDINSKDNNIAKLKMMTMILNESLRLYPPAVLITRKVARKVKLGEWVLPIGIELDISPLIVHHDTRLWGEDAHLFKPERFSNGVAAATKNTMSFLPFGAGPRNCVGQSLAMLEAKIAFSMILQRYSFTVSPAYVHAPVKHVTTTPQFGMQIILQKL